MTLGVILSLGTFIITLWYLCRQYHQDFAKIGFQLPLWLIVTYLLGRYFAVALATKNFLPHTLPEFGTILRPEGFSLHWVGILLALLLFLSFFLCSVKRLENKKIRIDILFSAFSNGLMVLGIFLVFGDTVIGKTTTSHFAVKALTSESKLLKFDGVYPVGLFLSFGVLLVNMIVHITRILGKKNWGWIWGFLGLLLVVNLCFLFQNYPRYGVISLWGISRDVKQYFSLFAALLCILTGLRWRK